MNWFAKLRSIGQADSDQTRSSLHDEHTFYTKFMRDLLEAKKEVIIESPFITTRRLDTLRPLFRELVKKNVKIYIMTRYPNEHDAYMAEQAEAGIHYFETLGIQVLLCSGGHHRKLAMIDRKVLWEGSLNILSQSYSREFMRRIQSRRLSQELFSFLKMGQFVM